MDQHHFLHSSKSRCPSPQFIKSQLLLEDAKLNNNRITSMVDEIKPKFVHLATILNDLIPLLFPHPISNCFLKLLSYLNVPCCNLSTFIAFAAPISDFHFSFHVKRENIMILNPNRSQITSNALASAK